MHLPDITFRLPVAALGLGGDQAESAVPCQALERPFQSRSPSQIPPEAKTVTMTSHL